jgi:crotonobetainyl-CoA:carnitine CoA-transferase CaiB-like acyl-CoA transferase
MTANDSNDPWALCGADQGILSGTKVLDLSRVFAGPNCTQMLSDHGASVIKIESPAGDETRGWGPPFHADGTSAYYHGINRNKLSVELDLTSAEGQRILYELAMSADVLIENFKHGTMARWGLDFQDVLAPASPRLIYCRITGYGVDGPMAGYPGYDAALQAYGGLMSVNGFKDREPLRVGVPIVDLIASHLAFSGILLALRERDSSGAGQLVDVTLLDAAISLLHPHSAGWAATGSVPTRTGGAHPTIAPYQSFSTAQGGVFIGAANNHQFAALMTALGMPEAAHDPRFADNAARISAREELAELIQSLVGRFDHMQLCKELLAAGVVAGPVHDISEALTDAQVLHRELFIDNGDYRGVGIPLKMSRSRPRTPQAARPRGADTRSVLEALENHRDTTR